MGNDMFENAVFEDLEPQQVEAIKALYNRIKGKKPNEILPIVMAFRMPQGKPISEEKKQKLIALVMEYLKN